MRAFAKKITYAVFWSAYRALDPLVRFREASVLCYHSISGQKVETAVDARLFERQLDELQARGYAFVKLSAVTDWAAGKGTLPRKSVALTFDDGYSDFETAALPILEKYHAPAALFVIGDPGATGWQNEPPFVSSQALLRLRQNPLVEIGYHSHSHPDLSKLSGEALQREVAPPLPARFFAYPGGNHSPQATEAVKAAGYAAAFTIRPVTVRRGMDPYLLPRSVVVNGMSPAAVAGQVMKAADWYYALARLFK